MKLKLILLLCLVPILAFAGGPYPRGTIILTTTGSSGAATFDGVNLNIPQYGGGGSNYLFTSPLTLTGTNVSIAANSYDAYGAAAGLLTSNNTFTGTNNFTGTLWLGGNPVVALNSAGNLRQPSYLTSGGYWSIDAVLSGDSRVNGGQGTYSGEANIAPYGYIERLPGQLQTMGFFQNGYVHNCAVAGTGLEDSVVDYADNSITTTGNVTSGTNTIIVTGSTSGISGNFGIGGPGIPSGMYGTITGTNITLHSYYGAANTPPSINNAPITTPVASTTGAALDILSPALGTFSTQTPHELSPAVRAYSIAGITSSTASYTLTGFSALSGVEIGSEVTGANIAANSTVVSWTSTTLTLNNYPTASSGSNTITITPVSYYFIQSGVNDDYAKTYSGITSNTGTFALTGFTGLNQIIPGYSVTGANIPANTVVVSNTATTVTINNHPTSSSGSNTITVTPVASAFETVASGLATTAAGDGHVVIFLTIIPAYIAPWNGGNTFAATINAWMLATYGTTNLGNGAYSGSTANVYVLDDASMPIWSNYNSGQIFVDGLHFSPAATQLWANFINTGMATLFPSQASAGMSIVVGAANSLPWNAIQPPSNPSFDPLGTGGVLTMGQAGSGDGITLSGFAIKNTSNTLIFGNTSNMNMELFNGGFLMNTAASLISWTGKNAGLTSNTFGQIEINEGVSTAKATLTAAQVGLAAWPAPSTGTPSTVGAAGSTTYSYVAVEKTYDGTVICQIPYTITTGNATLNGTNYNRITVINGNGAWTWDFYRTVSNGTPSSTGKIGSLSNFNTQFNDTGLAGDSTIPPAPASGCLTADHLILNTLQTTVTGSTSGTAVFTTIDNGVSYKKTTAACTALLGTAVYNFPTAYTNTNSMIVSGTLNSITTTTSTNMTITGATSSGGVTVEGY